VHPQPIRGPVAPDDGSSTDPLPRPPLPAPLPGVVGDRAWGAYARWRSDWRVGAALLAVVAALAGFLWYRAGAPAPPPGSTAETVAAAPGAGSTVASPIPTGSDGTVTTTPGAVATTPAPMLVHVAGAVVGPGVYGLAPGARVRDAVAAAGGPAPDADLDRLNLATTLADGQRVEVPRAGDPEGSGGVSGGDGTGATGGAPAAAGGPSAEAPLDLNQATAEELDALPGVGPSIAAAIVAQRESVGGFRTVEDLLEVRGIGEARLAELRPLVTV
jgi:competence protein ComEA